MFTIYRQAKWQQVQSCVNSITQGTTDQITSDDESDEDEEVEVFIQDIAASASDSEDEDYDEDVYSTDDSYDMESITRALCGDSCELERTA